VHSFPALESLATKHKIIPPELPKRQEAAYASIELPRIVHVLSVEVEHIGTPLSGILTGIPCNKATLSICHLLPPVYTTVVSQSQHKYHYRNLLLFRAPVMEIILPEFLNDSRTARSARIPGKNFTKSNTLNLFLKFIKGS